MKGRRPVSAKSHRHSITGLNPLRWVKRGGERGFGSKTKQRAEPFLVGVGAKKEDQCLREGGLAIEQYIVSKLLPSVRERGGKRISTTK